MELKRTYNVLNYNTSPIAIFIRRDDSILIPAGSDETPTAIALSPEEIQYASNMTNAFKIGLLRFEKEDEALLYDLCRIRNWKNIMTNADIEKIFTNFNLKKFEEVIKITDAALFNRIYGVYMGLKNAGFAMSGNVEQAMSLRYRELANGTSTTKIVLTKTEPSKDTSQEDKIKALEEQIAALTAMIGITPQSTKAPQETVKKTTVKKTTQNTTKK